MLGDVGDALRSLRSLLYASSKVGVIGYCSGGRQAFLAACLPFDAAVDCYGVCVLNPPPPGTAAEADALHRPGAGPCMRPGRPLLLRPWILPPTKKASCATS